MYTIHNIDARSDVCLCMILFKELIKKMKETENVK